MVVHICNSQFYLWQAIAWNLMFCGINVREYCGLACCVSCPWCLGFRGRKNEWIHNWVNECYMLWWQRYVALSVCPVQVCAFWMGTLAVFSLKWKPECVISLQPETWPRPWSGSTGASHKLVNVSFSAAEPAPKRAHTRQCIDTPLFFCGQWRCGCWRLWSPSLSRISFVFTLVIEQVGIRTWESWS